ncbi:MAG: hypothetical protein RIS79_1063 [Verrucomicrobiota bacterium]|jgi:hypothetical protein
MPNPFPSCDWGCVSPRTSEGFRKNVDSNRLFGLYLNEFLAKIMQKPISWPMHTQAYYLVVVNFLPYNWISFLLSLVLSDGSEARSSWVSGGHSGHRLSHRITDRLWQAGPREVPRPRRNPGGAAPMAKAGWYSPSIPHPAASTQRFSLPPLRNENTGPSTACPTTKSASVARRPV